jgi:hypothetical protein
MHGDDPARDPSAVEPREGVFAPAPRWSRALLLDAFSERAVAVRAVVALLTVLALRAALAPVGDTDAWWIATAGRELLARGAVPRANLWSITHPQAPWVFHEWLVAPLYALGCARFGSAFVAMLGVVGGCATVSALLAAQRAGGVRDDTAAWSVFAAMLALQASAVSPRPGYALLALPLVTLALTRAPRWSPRRVAALVGITALWTNAHGSFPVALTLVFAAALRVVGRERRVRLGALTLCAAATLANPYGASLHGLVVRYLRGGDPMAAVLRAEVLEFRPLWSWPEPFANGWVLAACAGLALLAARAAARGSRGERVDAALTLALIALGALQARHLALAATLGLALLGPSLDAERRDRTRWSLPRAWRLVAAPLALAGIALAVGPRDRVAATVGGSALPSLLRSDDRAWVPFDATGWFLWNARRDGDARLLFDARNDCHRAEVARDALALERGTLTSPTLCTTLHGRGVTVVVAPTDHPALQGVLRCVGWRVVRAAGGWTRAERADQRLTMGQTSPVAGFTRPGWSLQ